MSLDAGLYSLLAADPGVSALAGTRIYPAVAPQDAALPRIVHAKIHDGPEYVFGTAAPKRYEPLWQFSCFGATFAAAKALAGAVKTLLGSYTTGTLGGVNVLAMYLDDERYLYDPETKTHHIPVDVTIIHE